MPQALFPYSLALGLALTSSAASCVTPFVCDTDKQCEDYGGAGLRCESRDKGALEKRCYQVPPSASSSQRKCSSEPVAMLRSANPSDAGNRFGSALAAWGGSRLLVGNTGAKTANVQVGDAVVFDTTNNWKSSTLTSLCATSICPTLSTGAGFGKSVALSENQALVTADNPMTVGENQVTAYLFKFSNPGGWQKQQELKPAFKAADNNRLPLGVTLIGNHAFFATQHQEMLVVKKSIHDFSLSTGAPADPFTMGAGKGFGDSLVTAESRLFFGSSEGIFSHPIDASFTAAQPVLSSATGSTSLAASGNLVVYGTPGTNNKSPFRVASVTASSWNENVQQPPEDAALASYGQKIALDADLLAVSNFDTAKATGEVRIYQNVQNAWVPLTTLSGTQLGEADGAFGAALAVSKDYVFVGSPKSKLGDLLEKADGTVFVYSCPLTQ